MMAIIVSNEKPVILERDLSFSQFGEITNEVLFFFLNLSDTDFYWRKKCSVTLSRSSVWIRVKTQSVLTSLGCCTVVMGQEELR